MINLPNLRDLQYLKVLNNVKSLVIIFLILLTVYLLFNKPSIHTETKIQFDGLVIDSTLIDIQYPNEDQISDSVTVNEYLDK